MIETNVKFTEKEKLDFTYMLTAWNTSMEFCVRPLPVDEPLEEVEAYYEGVFAHMKVAKVKEHILRCQLSEKYNIPYDFVYQNGKILIAEESDRIN